MSEKSFVYSDFLILSATCDKRNKNLSDIFTAASIAALIPLSKEQLESSLHVLLSEGYITLADPNVTVINAKTSFIATSKGQNAASLSGISKIFSNIRSTKLASLEDDFTSKTYAVSANDTLISKEDYTSISRRLFDNYSINVPVVDVVSCNSGILCKFRSERYPYSPMGYEDLLGCHNENANRDDILKDGFDICISDKIPSDMLDAVRDLFTDAPRTRKFVINGAEQSFLFTLSPSSDGIRFSAAPIKYNRQRFLGKRDGELDYAQCGEDLLDMIVSPVNLGMSIIRAYTSLDDGSDTNMYIKINQIRRYCR